MKKNIKITPVGIKGYQINERMKELMGIKPINENKSNIVVELTKMGPDGNAYAVIRENHEWYIKKSSKTSNLLAEDFKYIGGLMNKKSEAYPSYAKAIKHLNLKFRSLAEAYNFSGEINLFENDNLISEAGIAGGFANHPRGGGFSGEGNLEGNKPTWENEVEGDIYDIKSLKELQKYKNFSKGRKIVKTVKFGEPYILLIDNNEQIQYYFEIDGDTLTFQAEEEFDDDGGLYENNDSMVDKMTEAEKAIDEMLTREELKGNQEKLDMNKNGKLDSDDFKQLRSKKGMEEMTDKEKSFAALAEPKDKITYADKIAGAKKESLSEHELGIFKTTNNMDDIIDSFTEGKIKKKVYTLK
jgi:hypothetical protein